MKDGHIFGQPYGVPDHPAGWLCGRCGAVHTTEAESLRHLRTCGETERLEREFWERCMVAATSDPQIVHPDEFADAMLEAWRKRFASEESA